MCKYPREIYYSFECFSANERKEKFKKMIDTLNKKGINYDVINNGGKRGFTNYENISSLFVEYESEEDEFYFKMKFS